MQVAEAQTANLAERLRDLYENSIAKKVATVSQETRESINNLFANSDLGISVSDLELLGDRIEE